MLLPNLVDCPIYNVPQIRYRICHQSVRSLPEMVVFGSDVTDVMISARSKVRLG